ncbi:hypothetical protein FB451DRAFT_1226130 [Mycena latifolia]|nr:hypothetical protein FB451DRAFT_1226130 [Mycena latifolia]
MANPNTIIVLGPSPESYYVGHGRRHFIENMVPGFMNHAATELNVSMTRWASVSKNGQTWIEYNVAKDNFHFNGDIHQSIRDHLSGTNNKIPAEFVSFPDSDDPAHYFVKGKNGRWTATLPDYFVQRLLKIQREVPGFDNILTGVLFGKGKTNIVCSTNGFDADLDDDEVKDEGHPLYKVLLEFSTPGEGWCIERGSTLCFYDSRYFYLKFKKPNESTIRMSWNLPPPIAEKLEALREEAKKPEEQMALMQQDQMWMNLATARMNNQMQMTNAMVSIMNQGALNIRAAASGGTVVTRYY